MKTVLAWNLMHMSKEASLFGGGRMRIQEHASTVGALVPVQALLDQIWIR